MDSAVGSYEVWVPITGFEGRYSVSSHGRVRREPQTVNRVAKPQLILSPGKCGKYPIVWLGGTNRDRRYVHHLVAQEFLCHQPPGAYVLHRNDVSDDNMVGNLYWGDASQNMYDSVRNGRHGQAKKTRCPRNHAYTPENTRMYRGRRFCKACSRRRDANRRKASVAA